MLSVRSKPGVVTHGEYVIGVGGAGEDIELVHDDIEILKWPENTQWRKVSAKLPALMYDILLTVSDGYIIIWKLSTSYKCLYKMLVSDIINLQYSIINWIMPNKWLQLTVPTHFVTSLVPKSSPVVALGGLGANLRSPTTDTMRYDSRNNGWEDTRSSLHLVEQWQQ